MLIFEWNMTSFVITMDTKVACIMMRFDNMLLKVGIVLGSIVDCH